MKKLAVITTHPIQYYAPVFKLMAQHIGLKVFYTWGNAALNKFDPGFGKQINWDIDLLDGYDYTWVKNTAMDAGSHHFNGIVTPGLVDDIKAYQPDALLVYGWAYKSHLTVMRSFKNKVPVYFRGDSTLLDEKPGIKSILKKLYLTWVYKHADHAFYTGTNNKLYYQKYGLTNAQLTFAPHAIDNHRFAADRSTEAAQLRQTLNIHVGDTLILFAGKLEPKKDPLLLLNAFIQLNQPGTHLLFAGNGMLEAQLKQQAQGHASIHFIDFKNQGYMPVLYQACNLFCLPSAGPGETWGLAVNEAMACSRAVLISDKVGCGTDLVKQNHNGAIFKSGSSQSLVQALQTLLQQKTRLHEYGQHSASIIHGWNFTKMAAAIQNKLLNETN